MKFDSEPVYGGSVEYKKTKINTYEDKINTVFHSNKCLSLIMLDCNVGLFSSYLLMLDSTIFLIFTLSILIGSLCMRDLFLLIH